MKNKLCVTKTNEYNALKYAVEEVCERLNDKKFCRQFYMLTTGSKVQYIERLAEEKLAEWRGEK